jgi:SAM-dependent methyltransferase
VTETAKREPKYLGGLSIDLELWNRDGAREWWKQFGEKERFTFRSGCYLGKEGEKLFYQLSRAIDARDADSVRSILPEMKKYCQANFEDLSLLEKWERIAIHMPGDIGGPSKGEVARIITRHARGRVLEAMCGFNSYFGKSPDIQEVVALDYCRAMLERYPFPERKRILHDLEKVAEGENMGFFREGEFQTVGCWGSNYLSEPVPVFAEFKRILSDGGRLIVLENTAEGYGDLVKRYFNPEQCAGFMQKAGLKPRIEPLKDLKTEFEVGHYSLVEGTK